MRVNEEQEGGEGGRRMRWRGEGEVEKVMCCGERTLISRSGSSKPGGTRPARPAPLSFVVTCIHRTAYASITVV